jgi:hypothetical protein
MFWAILSVFFLCNTLLVWGVFMQRRDPFSLPRVMKMNSFRIATMIGGMGWLVAPVMCFSAFGFIGAAAGGLVWLLSSAVIAFPLVGAAEGGITPVRG